MKKSRLFYAFLWFTFGAPWAASCGPRKPTPTWLPITPYPSYINQTIPESSQIVSLSDFQQGNHFGDTYILLASDRKKELVCVWIDPADLVENGDNFYSGLGDRLQLIVDNAIQPNEKSTGIVYDVNAQRMRDGEVVANWPVEEVACWPVKLGTGVHQAMISFRKTSGKIVEYSWWFEITNE